MQFGDELLEAIDRAASAHPRMDRIAPGADPLILRLKIKTTVEIQRRTVLVELGADPMRALQDEIDLLRPRKKGCSNDARLNALWTLALLPFKLRQKRSRLNRNPKDHFILDDKASDRLSGDLRLSGKYTKQERHEREDRPRDHLQPTAITGRFAVKR